MNETIKNLIRIINAQESTINSLEQIVDIQRSTIEYSQQIADIHERNYRAAVRLLPKRYRKIFT